MPGCINTPAMKSQLPGLLAKGSEIFLHQVFLHTKPGLNKIKSLSKTVWPGAEFKAGLHGDKVTAVEAGDIKRDIAYYSDTLNTAARIEIVCNKYNKDF